MLELEGLWGMTHLDQQGPPGAASRNKAEFCKWRSVLNVASLMSPGGRHGSRTLRLDLARKFHAEFSDGGHFGTSVVYGRGDNLSFLQRRQPKGSAKGLVYYAVAFGDVACVGPGVAALTSSLA